MRKILYLATLILLAFSPSGASAQALQISPYLTTKIKTLIPQPQMASAIHLPEVANAPVDGRAQAIEALLARYGSPLRGLGSEFVQVADRDGYDWRLLVSISGIESSFGLHQLGYNPFGWGGGRIPFSSFSDAIDQVSQGLAHGYISRGLTNPRSIQPVYCPPNPAWAAHVSSFMAQLN